MAESDLDRIARDLREVKNDLKRLNGLVEELLRVQRDIVHSQRGGPQEILGPWTLR